jgi:hypothetical protein
MTINADLSSNLINITNDQIFSAVEDPVFPKDNIDNDLVVVASVPGSGAVFFRALLELYFETVGLTKTFFYHDLYKENGQFTHIHLFAYQEDEDLLPLSPQNQIILYKKDIVANFYSYFKHAYKNLDLSNDANWPDISYRGKKALINSLNKRLTKSISGRKAAVSIEEIYSLDSVALEQICQVFGVNFNYTRFQKAKEILDTVDLLKKLQLGGFEHLFHLETDSTSLENFRLLFGQEIENLIREEYPQLLEYYLF